MNKKDKKNVPWAYVFSDVNDEKNVGKSYNAFDNLIICKPINNDLGKKNLFPKKWMSQYIL